MDDREFVNIIKKEDIKVSVVIPVYNVQKYIKRCLDSLVNQTLQDIEIIVVNDGSVDKSGEVIKPFLADKRVKYIEQENRGMSVARNNGLFQCSGEYISFIDSDDYVDLDFLERLYKAVKNADADVAASSIIRKRETYEKWRICYEKTHVATNRVEIAQLMNYPNQSYVWNKIYKKSFLDSINFKFEENVFYEDINALLAVILNCNKFVCVPNTNYYYMVNNGKSVVKGKKTLKKEKDRYNNQKKAINELIRMGIKIDRREYFIKKHEYTLFNFPILKIKEDLLEQKELFLLFNLIPVLYLKKKFLLDVKMFWKRFFSISKIDSHLLIMFLFIKLNIKYKTKVAVQDVVSTGVEANTRTPRLIASLTSFPDRIKTVGTTIKTLMNQTVKPDEIILYLAKEQFPNGEEALPSELLNLKEYGLKIGWCSDIRSYKKLIPALVEYPNDVIITFDDDIYYEKDTIEVLYKSYLEHPNEIQANRTWRVEVKNDKIVPLNSAYLYWNYEEYREASFLNTIIGCGGVLYPPNCLYKDVLDEKKFMELYPTQDDLWFYLMAILNGTRIRLNKGYSYNHVTVENTQNLGLCKINKSSKKGMSGKDGFSMMSEAYPSVVEILKKEKI